MKKPRPDAKRAAPRAAFDFNAAARKAAADHPALRRSAAFIDARSNGWIADDKLIEKIIDEDEMETIEDVVKSAKRLKTSFSQAVKLDRSREAHAIIFHPDRHPLFSPQPGVIDDTGSFDHETGHVLAPDFHDTLGENAADAYAMLRRLQRFGPDEADADYCGWKRALAFAITGATSHLTTFTVDKIVLDAKTADFISLSPKETAAIARAYAKAHTPDDKALKQLAKAFAPVKGKKANEETLREIARITLAAKAGSDIFYIGSRILEKPLTEKSVRFNGRTIALKGRYWGDIAARLDKKAKAIQQPRRN